jgi:pimeloyl-ACP methyl ester carboxylesterase
MPDSLARWYFDAPVQEIDTGTARLPCRRFGSGPPLLCVHGFPLSGFTWRKILPALAERFTCWVPDLPGLGDSTWTDGTDFSFPGQGRTLKALVDSLGLERYSVIAQDTGGTFARCLALEDGARIDKLVLINTEIPGHRPPWIPLYQLLMQIPGATIPFGLLLRSSAFLRSGMGFGGCFSDLSLIEGDFDAHVIQPLLASSDRMDGLARYLRGARWEPVDALATDHRRLAMPVHLVWGADDPTFPIELARRMVGQFPDASLVEIADARLLVHEEKPAEVTRAVLAFLGSDRSASMPLTPQPLNTV